MVFISWLEWTKNGVHAIILVYVYDNHEFLFSGPPTVVDVNLNIRSMGPISEKEMVNMMNIDYCITHQFALEITACHAFDVFHI